VELFFNFIPRCLILFYFCVKFYPHSFQIYSFYPFFIEFVFSILSIIILVGWEFEIIFFFKFAVYAVIWSHDLCHEF